MDMLIKLIVCLIAGLGAGLGTGFAGMSAAAVITPMLATFLGMDTYAAVGIALAFRIYHDRETINVDELNRMKG